MESEEVSITEKDVVEAMDTFTKIPAFLLKRWISKNKNLVKTFQGQIEGYKDKMSDKDMVKLNTVMNMSVDEIQDILDKAYQQTQKKQLKILADPPAKTFIEMNMHELRNIFYG